MKQKAGSFVDKAVALAANDAKTVSDILKNIHSFRDAPAVDSLNTRLLLMA